MGITANWYDDAHTIIYYTFEGIWTWDEYQVARQQVHEILDTVDYPVDQIFDLTDAPVPPKNIVSKFRSVAITSHDNASGLVVVVGQNKLLEMLTNTVGKVVKIAQSRFDISYISDKSQLKDYIEQRRQVHRG